VFKHKFYSKFGKNAAGPILSICTKILVEILHMSLIISVVLKLFLWNVNF